MCGPTSEEKALQASSMNFASLLQKNYAARYASQTDVLNAINRSLSPILSAGPNQHGFSGPQLAAYQTQAINQAGAAAKNAEQAARTFGAGEGGGGTSGLTSGITKQIESSIASQEAQNLGNQQNQITQADYALGSQNYWRAAGGAQSLAAGYNPSSEMGGAIGENSQSFGQASQIQQQQQQEDQMIAGGITSLASNVLLPGISGGINASPGQSFGSGFAGAFGH